MWYRVASKEVEVQKGTASPGSDSNRKGKEKETPVFELESITLFLQRVLGTYNRPTAIHTQQNTNFSGETIHF